MSTEWVFPKSEGILVEKAIGNSTKGKEKVEGKRKRLPPM
jgi:hypothetical protein